MRNLTVPEACLLVGTVLFGSGALLAVESGRLERARSTPLVLVQAEPAMPAAMPAPTVVPPSLPSSPPLDAPAVEAVPEKKKGPRCVNEKLHRKPDLKAPVDPFGDCEDSKDPLCGGL